MVSVEDTSLQDDGPKLKSDIWKSVKPIIEDWTQMELQPSSQYGIREYTRGAVLSPHVDRMPLVSSCIINVDQDVEEDWMLEVIDRQGHAVNVSMQPGDMVLYESGSLIHGRPFPLKGNYFANIFIHFEPTGRPLGDTTDEYLNTLDDFYPPYLLPDSPAGRSWAEQNPNGWKTKNSPSSPQQQIYAPAGHHAAALGDMELLQNLAQTDKKALVYRDENGWEPLHEAVRRGQLEAVQFLIQEGGANINSRTGTHHRGESPLNLALQHLTASDAVTRFLLSNGAEDHKYEL